jgi:hypothetical protein
VSFDGVSFDGVSFDGASFDGACCPGTVWCTLDGEGVSLLGVGLTSQAGLVQSVMSAIDTLG